MTPLNPLQPSSPQHSGSQPTAWAWGGLSSASTARRATAAHRVGSRQLAQRLGPQVQEQRRSSPSERSSWRFGHERARIRGRPKGGGAKPRAPASWGTSSVTKLTTPDSSQYLPTFNDAGLLDKVDVKIRGASAATNFVHNIDYDAKGQRSAITYSHDGTNARFSTAYTYDPLTYRLKRLVTTRVSPSSTLQDLSYTFDAVGNIVQISDAAQQAVYFDNSVVLPANDYVYDAVYRLVSAKGREHKSIGDTQVDHNDAPLQNLPHANDSQAVRNYEETYVYDRVGNILELFHNAGNGTATWRRYYDYGPFTGVVPDTNRLRSTSLTGDTPGTVPYSAQYTHDVHGSMTAMPHLSTMTMGPFDQMVKASNGTQDTYFTYGADGQRVRKVYDTNANLKKERIYLGSYEIYRERTSSGVQFERHTLHVMDDAQRIAMVETKTIEGGAAITPLVNKIRFQLGNHLGSAVVECTETGAVISYEEYHPYGSSAYRSANGSVDVSARRYRYNGKERDEETGLYYYGARYLAAWLGRWTSADPLGIGADGPGLYNYTRGSPVNYVDPNGLDTTDPAPASRVWKAESPPPGGKSYPRQSFGGTGKAGTGPTASASGSATVAKPDPFEMAAKLHGSTEAELRILTHEWQQLQGMVNEAKAEGRTPMGPFWNLKAFMDPQGAANEKAAQVERYIEAGLAKRGENNHVRSTVRDQAEAAGWLKGDKAAKFDKIATEADRNVVHGWALGQGVQFGLAVAPGGGGTGGLFAKAPQAKGAVVAGAKEAAELLPYRVGKGHHIPAKVAFEGVKGYDALEALAIPKAELAKLGIKHSNITGAQATLYRAFATTGKKLTWKAMEDIETAALVHAGSLTNSGLTASGARATVQSAIEGLRKAGIKGASRIPWGG